MIDITIRPEDLAEISKMPRELKSSTEEALAKVLSMAVREVKASFPRSSGRSADSFTGELSRLPAGPEAAVESDWFVTRLQEYGYAGHYHILPSGAKAWIPGKPRSTDGHHAWPAVERVLEHVSRELEEAVDRL